MMFHRTLTTATSAAALTALLATPALAAGGMEKAQGADATMQNDAAVPMEPGDSTLVVEEQDAVQPPHADIEAMIITEGRIVGGGDGFETGLVRSDTWEPGMRKTQQGDYYKVTRQTPSVDPGEHMERVRSDTWQPGYRKTQQGDYYKLQRTDATPYDDDMEVAVIVEPTDRSAAQVVTIGGNENPSNVIWQRRDTWKAGFVKSQQGDYYRQVIIRRSLPASELPDFD